MRPAGPAFRPSTTMSALTVLAAALLSAPPAKPGPAPQPGPEARPAGEAPSPAGKASALAAKVQRFYDELEDYEARFVQTYTRFAMSRTSESSGIIQIKKGGKVRWAYEEPEEKLFVADGQTLWVYEPLEAQVVVDRRFSTKRFGHAVSFLWGEGKLTDSFDIAAPDPTDYDLPPDAAVLELRPKTDRTFRKLVLRVDRGSGRVEESILFETSKNTNRFQFFEPKLNQGLKDSQFEFVPPAGVDVVPVGPS